MKIGVLIAAEICLLIITILQIINLRVKIRSLIVNRVNEFYATDILTIIQSLIGMAILILMFYLFSEKFDEQNFKIVISNEREFDRWVIWSFNFNLYRVFLGVQSIVIVVNFLMISSENIPNLGVLFETIERSRSDIIFFTMIFLFLYFAIAVICNALFGLHDETFSSMFYSCFTIVQMCFGKLDYRRMFDADSGSAAVVFVIFVYVFYFMLRYMYLAIVTRTYITLRKKKLFVSEAMARLLWNRLKTQMRNWWNLIFMIHENRRPD